MLGRDKHLQICCVMVRHLTTIRGERQVDIVDIGPVKNINGAEINFLALNDGFPVFGPLALVTVLRLEQDLRIPRVCRIVLESHIDLQQKLRIGVDPFPNTRPEPFVSQEIEFVLGQFNVEVSVAFVIKLATVACEIRIDEFRSTDSIRDVTTGVYILFYCHCNSFDCSY